MVIAGAGLPPRSHPQEFNVVRVRDRKTRLLLIFFLLLVLGLTAYPISRYLGASRHQQVAQEALEKRDFRQATLHFEKCLEVWPGDLSVRLAAAQTARRQGDFQKAAQHLHSYEQ